MDVVRVIDVLVRDDTRATGSGRSTAVSLATGFDVLDDAVGGGVRTGEVTVIGGPPGSGKTTLALQMARSFARQAVPVLFVTTSDRPTSLVDRLALMELAETHRIDREHQPSRAVDQRGDAPSVLDAATPAPLVTKRAPMTRTADAFRASAEHLRFVQGSTRTLQHESIRTLVEDQLPANDPCVLVIDPLHRVVSEARIPAASIPTDDLRTHDTLGLLKELALQREMAVIGLAGVDYAGLRATRRRLYHLRGAPAIAADADLVLLLNSKERIASRVHRTFDPVGTRSFRPWVVATIEKNRHGPTPVDLELRHDARFHCFDPNGALVTDSLLDDQADEF